MRLHWLLFLLLFLATPALAHDIGGTGPRLIPEIGENWSVDAEDLGDFGGPTYGLELEARPTSCWGVFGRVSAVKFGTAETTAETITTIVDAQDDGHPSRGGGHEKCNAGHPEQCNGGTTPPPPPGEKKVTTHESESTRETVTTVIAGIRHYGFLAEPLRPFIEAGLGAFLNVPDSSDVVPGAVAGVGVSLGKIESSVNGRLSVRRAWDLKDGAGDHWVASVGLEIALR